jgi:restriction system-associated AAA family ATPase
MHIFEGKEWTPVASNASAPYLPSVVIGYTSGENETLSLPFAVSRMEYADRVGKQAIGTNPDDQKIPDTRLMLLDYSTHLEVLVANLILGEPSLVKALLSEPQLQELRSFRCIIQLHHRAAPLGGIQLTDELKEHIANLQSSATCWDYQEDLQIYTFDFLVSAATREAFRHHWNDSLTLYRSLHKLAMLNDLALPRYVQQTFRRDVANRRFATRMPEPPELDKVFRFERVTFLKSPDPKSIVDYVSLSDGEHQLVQVLGICGMIAQSNAFFILDEPESHFNPQWRVKFVQKMREVPTSNGARTKWPGPACQEMLLTTHAPFVPSDMSRENVLVFSKTEVKDEQRIEIHRPDIETFGTTFDRILEHCFSVRPPISAVARAEIDRLLKSSNENEIETGMARLGASVEKTYLGQHLRELKRGSGEK